MSKQTNELSTDTFNKWRKGLKNKDPYTFLNPPIKVTPVAPPPNHSNQNPTDLAKAFESLFAGNDPERIIKYNRDIWKINFPKIAEDLIDPKEFKQNVVNSVLTFIRINFPLDIEVGKGVQMRVDCINVENDEYGNYPKINFKPEFEGPFESVHNFLRPFEQWSGHELYWKGSFLKSKTTGKITGMRLTGLAYNVPDKFRNGQPISYVEKTVV